MPTPFVSKRAPIYADVPDEKWNDWRWQLSHRLNTAEEIEKVIHPDRQRAQGAANAGPVPRGYHALLYLPDRPGRPERPGPQAGHSHAREEMQAFTAMMEDSLAEDRHSPVPGPGAPLS